MAIKTKRLSDILTRLIDLTTSRTSQLTDYTPGSTIRSIYEAISMELETYYALQEQNISWGIEQGVLASFGFTRRQAKVAYGDVELIFYTSLASDTILPKGMTFYSTDSDYPNTYVLQQAYTVPAGAVSATVRVFCTVTGSTGNIPAEKINAVSNGATGLSRVSNPSDINTGTDEETLAAVRQRFQNFVDTRGRGTIKAMDYAARRVEEVTGVYIYEEVGKITVYAHDANGDLPSEVKAAIEASEETYRPVGIPWSVAAVTKTLVPITAMVTITNLDLMPTNFEEKLGEMIKTYLNAFNADDDLIISELNAKIMNFSPLVYDVQITSPSENTVVGPSEIIRAGDIQIIIDNEE